jgi:cardiolipin synthase A/B
VFEDWHIWTWCFVASEWVIRIVMVVIIPIRRSPTAARTWLLLILFEPYIGLALFLVIGSHRLPRWRREMMARLPTALSGLRARLANHPNIAHPELSQDLQQAVRLAESLGQLPILGGNAVDLLNNYQGTIDRLVNDIDAAQHTVHLLFYIFAVDRTTERVIAALARATQRGVQCRVLVDSLASRRHYRALAARLGPAGVRLEESLPVGFWRLLRWRTARIDLRNHRKIAVIDGRIGYVGSQNLVDPKFVEGLTYDELMVRVAGPVVLELQYVFAGDWFVETEEVLDGPDVFPDPELTGQAAAQALPSGPGLATETNQRLFVSLIHGARKKVVMTTPYFVPDETILQAMQIAVLRGVEVHLIVSEKADQFLVSSAQRSYYSEMLEDGIRIHLYRRHFLHAKHLSIDDEVALIGSSNMDIRSFELNNEILVLFYGDAVAARLHQIEDRYLRNCRELDAREWEKRSWLRRVGEALARQLSPLL